MISRWFSAGAFAAVWFFSSLAYPCTTFLAQHADQPVVGKDYDWQQSAGLVVTNPRGMSKSALTINAEDTPAAWVSKYASITFNQYGIELPNGGMNEKGLTVEIMWLDSTQYPATDGRPVLTELQWIQYALDGFATVAEFIPASAGIRVSRAYANVHYLVCDATSDCAAFEYLNGNLVVTRSADMPAKTLANDTYADSSAYLALFQEFGGTAAIPSSSSSLDRFVRASSLALTTQASSIPTSAFQILESVTQDSTVWSIVYVPMQGTVHFRTRTMPKIKSVSLANFALGCPAQRKVLDIDTDAIGDVAPKFIDYTSDVNRQLIMRTVGSVAGDLPGGVVELLAAYPDTCSCISSGTSAGGSGGGTGLSPLSGTNAAGSPGQAETGSSGCSVVPASGTEARSRALLLAVLCIVGLRRSTLRASVRRASVCALLNE